jgi:hypothetical protein
MAYEGIHLPRGYEVAVKDDTDTWQDLGVTMEDGTLEATYDKLEVTGSQAEKLLTVFKNFSVSSTFTLTQIKLENLDLLMSGATSYTETAAGTTAETETITAGSWALDTWYAFDEQSDDTDIPTSITIQNPTGTTLVLDTDYVLYKVGDEWGYKILDTATTDIAENLELAYTTEQLEKNELSIGSSSVEITPRAFRIRKNLGTASTPIYFSVEVYSAVNEGGLSLAFPRYDADGITTIEVQLNGSLDTTRSDLDQLLKITDYTAA